MKEETLEVKVRGEGNRSSLLCRCGSPSNPDPAPGNAAGIKAFVRPLESKHDMSNQEKIQRLTLPRRRLENGPSVCTEQRLCQLPPGLSSSHETLTPLSVV